MSNTKNKKLKILSMVCAGLMASAVIIAPAVACSRTYSNKFFINYDIEVLVSSHNDKKSFKLKLPIKNSIGLTNYCRIHPTYKPNIEMTIWHYNPSTNRHEDHTKQVNVPVSSRLIDDYQYLLIDLPAGDYHEKDNLSFTDLNHVIQGQSFDLYQSYFKYDESVSPKPIPKTVPTPSTPIKTVDSGTQTDPITIPAPTITPSKQLKPSTSESGTETDPVITPKPSKPAVSESGTQTDTTTTIDGGTQTDTPSVSEGGTQTDPITPSPTPSVPTPDTKKDEAVLSGLETPTKGNDSNQIKFDFSKFTLKDESQKVLKLTLLNGNETKEINLTLSDDKSNAIANLKDLKAGTYKIAKLTLNGKEINLGAIKDQEFKIEVPKTPVPAPIVPSPLQPKPVEEVVPQMLFSVNTNEADKSLHVSLTPDIISFLKKHQSEIDPNDQIELNIHLSQLNKANTPDELVVKDNKTIVYKLKDLISSDHSDLTRLNLDPNTIDRTSLTLQKMSIDVKNTKLLDQLKAVIKVKDVKNNNDIQVPFTTKISDTKYEHEFKNPPLFISKFDEFNQKYYDHYVNNILHKKHQLEFFNPDLYLTLSKKEESTPSESLNYFNIKGPLNQYLKHSTCMSNQDDYKKDQVIHLSQDDYMELNYSIDQLNDQTHKIDSTPYSLKLKLSDLRDIDSDEIDMSLLTSNNHKDQYELLKQPNTRLVLHSFTFNTKDPRLSSNISTFFRIVDQKDQDRWTALPNLTKIDSKDLNKLNLEKSIVVKDFDENTLKQWSKKEILTKETVITPVSQPTALPLTNSLFTKTNKNQDFSETQEWLTLSKPYTQTYHIENIDLDTLPDNVSVVVSYDGMPSITVKVPKSSFTNINQLHTSCDVNITLPINEYLQKMDINNSEILAPTLKSVTLQYPLHSQDKHFKTFDLLKLNPTISTLKISDEDKIEISTDPQKYMKQLPPVFEDLHVEKSSNPSFDSYFVKFKVILTSNYAKLIENIDNKFNVELKSSNKVVYTKEFNNVGGNNYASSSDYVIINHGDKDHETNLDHNTTLFVTLKVPKSAIKNENNKLVLSKFEFGGTNFALTREEQRPKLFNISVKNPGPLKQD